MVWPYIVGGAISILILYFVVKSAVKNGMIEAFNAINHDPSNPNVESANPKSKIPAGEIKIRRNNDNL